MPNAAIFFMTVTIWGSTWIAIKLQTGAVAPEASIAYRFIGAALLLLLWCLVTRRTLRYPPLAHGFMALQGLCLFCLNYIPLYWASLWLPSGLVAVGFSTVILFSVGLGAVVHRRPIERRVAAGALLGLGSRNQKAGIPVLQSAAFGMLYGGLATAIYVAVSPVQWSFDLSAAYTLSLGYLILFGSVIGFWGYLSVVGRMGPERASYIPVLFPVVALGISTVAEGYSWTAGALTGVACLLAGNLLVLLRLRLKVPGQKPSLALERS